MISAYVPSSGAVAVALGAALLGLLGAGFVIVRFLPTRVGRVVAWAITLIGTVGVEQLSAREAAGVRMLALIAFALLGLKAIVVIEEQARGMAPLSLGKWLGFAAGWLGMQPRRFAGAPAEPRQRAKPLFVRGIVWMVVGAALVAGARIAWTSGHSRLLASIFLLPGMSFLVHFGLCNLLAAGWRTRGVNCDALFRDPLRSQNLAEFWARRWNLAFSEMTAIAVYRPLSPRLGRGPALLAGFLLSGLLHEVAISVPVRSGYGLPFLYFALQGGLVLLERTLADRGRPLNGWLGRAWAIAWLVGPLPMLFHPPFLAGVVWPLIGIPPRET